MDIGTWGRASGFVGMVVATDDDGTLVLFNPGDRQILRATPGAVQALPTGAIEVSVRITLDVPHGLEEGALNRWLGAMVDPVLRGRARQSLAEAGMATVPFDVEPVVDVREVTD